MSVAKVIEVLSQSKTGFDDAVREGIAFVLGSAAPAKKGASR
jgi:hypothetical protein